MKTLLFAVAILTSMNALAYTEPMDMTRDQQIMAAKQQMIESNKSGLNSGALRACEAFIDSTLIIECQYAVLVNKRNTGRAILTDIHIRDAFRSSISNGQIDGIKALYAIEALKTLAK